MDTMHLITSFSPQHTWHERVLLHLLYPTLRGTGRYYVVQRQNPRRAGTNGGSMYPAYLGSGFMPGPSLRNLVF